MSTSRLIYHNWIAEHGPDPGRNAWTTGPVESNITSDRQLEELREIVKQAVESLDEQERFLVFRYYYLGQSFGEMSLLSGRALYRLAALHRRALRKLRRHLAGFVKARYDLTSQIHCTCPVCQSPHRKEIEAILRSRDRRRSWKPVLELLNERFDLTISTPQVLIGHEKYHWQIDHRLRREE